MANGEIQTGQRGINLGGTNGYVGNFQSTGTGYVAQFPIDTEIHRLIHIPDQNLTIGYTVAIYQGCVLDQQFLERYGQRDSRSGAGFFTFIFFGRRIRL